MSERYEPSPAPESETAALRGIVAATLYYNEATGYRVIRLEPDGGGRPISATGVFGELHEGEHVVLRGRWNQHARYGREFRATGCEVRLPESRAGLERYLGSGLIPGVGPGIAQRIAEHFGKNLRAVLDREAERLGEVKGVGARKARAIAEFWRRRDGARELLLLLGEHGMGLGLGLRIHKTYGDEALAVVRRDPYRLIYDVSGVGFQTADRIAQRLGMAPDSPERLRAGLIHQMERAGDEGHCFLPHAELLAGAAELLRIESTALDRELQSLVTQGLLALCAEGVQHPQLQGFEEQAAHEVLRRALAPPVLPLDHGCLARVLPRGVALAQDQIAALETLLSRGFSVLTGGPGVGKTTLVQVLVAYFEAMGFAVVLAAPTGRAAQRLEEATGRPASTLHRLLKYQPGRDPPFQHGYENPLPGRVFIVDEFSMVDLPLFHALLAALPANSQLIAVGDKDQLPSVGPGRVLGDILESGRVAAAVLEQVHRQAAGSLLVRNSHRLLRRLPPLEEHNADLSDFYFIEPREDFMAVMDKLLTERLPLRFGKEAAANVQVLSPMKKGPLGTEALNEHLQQLLNPGNPPLRAGGGRYRSGDRVIQLANNYELDLYNGDIGRVAGEDGMGLLVDFNGKMVSYMPEAISSIALAYACTVHKAQGSEYQVVIMPLHRGHRHMLSLPLLYTALTRARKLCLWVGQRDFLRAVLENPMEPLRHTRLKVLLQALRPAG